MRKLLLLATATVLLAGACQSTSQEEAVLAQMEPRNSGDVEAAMTDTQAAPTAAEVTFDGERCLYEGPVTMPAQVELTFEFSPTVEPEMVALVVGPLKEGYTWEEVLEYSDENPAGDVPPFADPGYQIQYGPGSLVVTMEAGEHFVICDTSPTYTNSRHPAALIEMTNT